MDFDDIEFDDLDDIFEETHKSGYYDEKLRFSTTRKKIASYENAREEVFKISADNDILTIENAKGCIVSQSDLHDENMDCNSLPEFEPSEHRNTIESYLKSNQRHFISGYGSCVLGINPYKEVELRTEGIEITHPIMKYDIEYDRFIKGFEDELAEYGLHIDQNRVLHIYHDNDEVHKIDLKKL